MIRNIKLFSIFLIMLMMSACVTNGDHAQVLPIDRISAEELARIMPKPVAALSLDDLVKLSKEGASAAQIIEKIQATNSLYALTPSQSVALNKQGVDSNVLDYIYNSREQALKNNVADEINKREALKQKELNVLKNQQLQQPLYDPFCRYGPYGTWPYGYGSYRRGYLNGCW